MSLFDDWVSVKSFSDREVEREKLKDIFEDTSKAPTAYNLQPYSFKVLEGEAFDKATSCLTDSNEWVKDADKIVLLIGDERIDTNLDRSLEDQLERGKLDEDEAKRFRQDIEGYRDRSEGFKRRWLTRNTMIPAAFFMLSCRERGIGCCPVKGFDEEKVSRKLALEDHERPQLMIPVGYPDGESERLWRRSGEDIYEYL